MGDKPVAHYTAGDANEFVSLLSRLPVGVNQRHPFLGSATGQKMTAREAIRLADKIEEAQVAAAEAKIKRGKVDGETEGKLRQEARVERLSTTVVVKHRDHCNAVFKYLQGKLNVAFKSPFMGIRPDRPTKGDVRDERDAYTDAQVRRIFASPLWTGSKSEYFFCEPGTTIKKNEKYWVVVIACLTGMRLEEICQLWLDDIVNIDGIWCFLIWNAPERQLKNDASERVIPIPDALIRLGLLSRVDMLRKEGKYRLFPKLKRGTKINPKTGLGKLGPALTRSMGRYFRLLGLAEENQLFHAFRHTFATKLGRAKPKVETRDINDIMGHLQGGSESERRYIKRERILQLKEYMERVDFGFQFVEVGGEWHFAKPSDSNPAGE